MALLEIKNLHVDVDGKKILNGLNLTVCHQRRKRPATRNLIRWSQTQL